jgi:glycosyltransferase involved in cell wall biosynthesis
MKMSLPASPAATKCDRSGPLRLSCVVPAYNEGAHLAGFLRDLAATLAAITPQFEIIVVNDGSADDTEQQVNAVAEECGVRYLGLSRNFGKEAALTAGIDCAAGDAVILLDADYQHPLALLPEMVALWRAGYDMVYGVIADRRHESRLKRWGVRLFYRVLESDTAVSIPRNAGDFRLLDRRVVTALRQLPERNRFMKGLYAWVGFKSVALPFLPCDRASGHSRYTFRSLQELALSGLTAFTTLPLRVWSAIGASISLLALIYAVWVAVSTLLFGNPTPGWTTLTVGLMFFSGVQLFSIGILGEYLGRVYEEVKRRPMYLVADDCDHGRLDPAQRLAAASVAQTAAVAAASATASSASATAYAPASAPAPAQDPRR